MQSLYILMYHNQRICTKFMVPRKEDKPRLPSDCSYAPQASFKMAAQHPTDANISTDSLDKIPDNISISYLPESDSLSKKALEKGLNYFTQGYVHNIRISEINDAVRMDARCWRSMRKNEAPHTLQIEINGHKITESYCSCKAG